MKTRLIISASILVAAACGPEHSAPLNFKNPDEIIEKVGSCDLARESFEKSLRPLTEQSCARCHGADQVPLFASKNLDIAFTKHLLLLNFQEPQNSIVIRQASNNHCGERDCQQRIPGLVDAVDELATTVRVCQQQSERPPVDPSIGYEYFKKRVRPTLEHRCAACHGRSSKFEPIKGIIADIYDAPEFLMGSTPVVYEKVKQFMALDKDSFYAAEMYGAAALPHYSNGKCESFPDREKEDNPPCLQLREWWVLEKHYLDSITP